MAVTADMRQLFGVSISDIARRIITWGQYRDLVDALCSDPTSRTFAAVSGWAEPMSPGWLQRNLLASWVSADFAWPWLAIKAMDADRVQAVKADMLARSPLLRGLTTTDLEV